MAFMRNRSRTILLDFGSTDMLSDLHGVHALRVRPGAGAEMRKQLADRLRTAGCPASTEGSDWMSAGNFDAAFLEEAPSQGAASGQGAASPAGRGSDPPHPVDPTATTADNRVGRARRGGGDNRSVTARDITGASLVTGDNNRVSTSMRQVSLPAAAEVDVRTELAALRRVLAGLEVPERGKLDPRHGGGRRGGSQAPPRQGGARRRARARAQVRKAAEDFGGHAERLAPRIAALGAWLGAHGRGLLANFGIGA